MGLKSVVWDFGPPGHGKGEWDGLGGMLKQWIRQRKLSKLAVNLNDSVVFEESEVKSEGEESEDEESDDEDSEDNGLLASAKDCYEKWKSHFDTEDWRQSARDGKRAVTAIYFHWAGPEDIVRPSPDEQFDHIEGISSSYQFFMLRKGEVLMRKHSCWCSSCFDVATAGSGRDMKLSSQAGYTVTGCSNAKNSFYEWSNKSCIAITGCYSCSPDVRAMTQGHYLAENVLASEGGEWVLFEAFCDEEDELWLGRTVACTKLGGVCKKKHTGKQCHRFGTRIDKGDYMVAVQWYQRLCESGDGERREFVMAKRRIDIVNSSELRLAAFELKQIGEFSADVCDTGDGEVSGGADDTTELGSEGRRKWELTLSDESEALSWCR